MVASDWMLQFLADMLDAAVERPQNLESTALGAAYLAGLHLDMLNAPDEMAKAWHLDRRFFPR